MTDAVKEFPLEEEYKKPHGIKPEDIRLLREWLQTQPHLPGEHITDLDLILTYHSCNHSLEQSKKVLDLNYTLRTLFTNFFKDRVVDERIAKTLDVSLLTPLPTRTKEGYAFMYMRFLDFDPKKYVVADVIRTTFMILDLWQFEEGTWPGFVIAVDMEGSTVSHLSKWDLQTMQQFSYYLTEVMLVNFKGFHFLNATPFMDKVTTLLRPFMKKTFQEAMFIHQAGSNSFEKFFPIEGMPKEFGGKYKTYQECKEDVLRKLKSNPEFFVNENKKRVVEAKRPGKPKTLSDFFGGILGSFKKLDID